MIKLILCCEHEKFSLPLEHESSYTCRSGVTFRTYMYICNKCVKFLLVCNLPFTPKNNPAFINFQKYFDAYTCI